MNYKRYFPPSYLEEQLKNFNSNVKRTVLGRSVNGLPVYQLQIGNGDQNILMWSQMHGNETTTTIALLDFINALEVELGKKAKKNFTEIQPGEIVDTVANIENIKQWVNFIPKTNLKKGIKLFVKWYLNYYS